MLKKAIGSIARSLAWLSTTRTNYWAEYCVDLTLVGVLVFAGLHQHALAPWMVALALAVGLLGFSFAEYCFHRWLFHTRIPLFEEGHRMHHENPLGYDALPFFLPAVLSVSLTALFSLLLPTAFVFLMMAAVTFGYVFYGFSHFAIHHVRFRQPLLRKWAAAHHIHHHHAEKNFGVTSPLWDVILRTRYQRDPGRVG